MNTTNQTDKNNAPAEPSEAGSVQRVDGLHEYKLHWKGGEEEIVTGTNVADAMNKRGYGRGAVAALDYYSEVAAPVSAAPITRQTL